MSEKKALIYARVSAKKQADADVSIPSQLERGRVKAAELGATVALEFVDAGRSAFKGVRADFEAAIEYAELYEIDFFIVWSSSRFARNRYDAAINKRRLDKAGVRLVYITSDIDRDTDSGRIFDAFLEIIDESRSIETSRDTKRSLIANARQGFFNGGTPCYGFTTEVHPEHKKRKRLVVDDQEAVVVLEIFKMRAKGLGSRSICRNLNDRGLSNRGRRWNKSVLNNLLRNPIVIGQTVFNKKNSATNRPRPKEEWIVISTHKPVVPIELWEIVQTMMEEAADNTMSASSISTWTFTGLLRCGECGAPLYTESASGRTQKYWYYICSAAKLHKVHAVKRYRTDYMDDWLQTIITKHLFSYETLINIIAEMNAAASVWAVNNKQKKTKVISEMQDCKKRIGRLYSLLEESEPDDLNLGDISPRLRELKAKQNNLDDELQRLDKEQPPQIEVTEADASSLREFLIKKVRETKDGKKLRSLFAVFVREIRVNYEDIVIEYDPESLVTSQASAVRQNLNWLPELAGRRTKLIAITLPVRFRKAA